jgi:hypothetical protein
MRVGRLFVIAVQGSDENDNADTLACADALTKKYKSKCKSVTSIQISYPEKFNMMNPVANAGQIQINPGASSTDESMVMAAGGDMVGAYVVGNFYRAPFVLEGLSIPLLLSKAIKGAVGDRLDKLCLVACSVSRHGKRTSDNTVFPPSGDTQNSGDKCFIYGLCQALHDDGLNPLMAGWDDYVEVAHSGRKNTYYEEQKGKDVPGHNASDSVGKKIVTVGDYTGFASGLSDQLRKQHKRVIKFDSGKPTWQLEMAGWSQKV